MALKLKIYPHVAGNGFATGVFIGKVQGQVIQEGKSLPIRTKGS